MRRALKEKAGLPTWLAKNLGIDTSGGRPRSFRARCSTRSKRLAGTRPRVARLRRLAKAGAKKVGKIFTTGIRPQAVYGAEVHGLSPGELDRLERTASSCYPPFWHGKVPHAPCDGDR